MAKFRTLKAILKWLYTLPPEEQEKACEEIRKKAKAELERRKRIEMSN